MEMTPPTAAVGTALAADRLRMRCDPERFAFATTAELEHLETAPGQERAAAAIAFGVGMQREGYNLFAMGPAGFGRHTLVRARLEAEAAKLAPPRDWCYVNNFESPHRPRSLGFPAGEALRFKAHMERLVEDLGAAITAAFETDEYRTRHHEIEAELEGHQERSIGELGDRAKTQGIALVRTPAGFAFAPMEKDAIMSPEKFGALPEAEQKRL